MSKVEGIMCGVLGASALLSMAALAWSCYTEPLQGQPPTLSHRLAEKTVLLVASPWLILMALFVSLITLLSLPFKGVNWVYEHCPPRIQKILEKIGFLAVSPIIGMMYLGCILLTPLGIIFTIIFLIVKALSEH